MLQSAIGKPRSERESDAIGIAMTRTEQLHRVGRERARAIETAVDHPRMLAVLREVLAAHHDGPVTRIVGDVVVDILRRVRLVVGDEGTDAQSQVLHEDGIDRHCDFAFVRRVDAPEPCALVGEQAQHHAMADGICHAFPDDAIVGDAKPNVGVRTNYLDVVRARAACA